MLEIETATLAADAQARNESLVTLRAAATQVIEQTAPPRNHLEQTSAGMMVLGVRFEMHCQLIDALAQDCDLNLWRAGVRLVDPELGNRFALCFTRQRHSGIDTPRLFLTVYFRFKE